MKLCRLSLGTNGLLWVHLEDGEVRWSYRRNGRNYLPPSSWDMAADMVRPRLQGREIVEWILAGCEKILANMPERERKEIKV